MHNKKNILWDLDGTIVESEDAVFKLNMFIYASNRIGLNFNLKEEQYIGHEAKNIFKLLLVFNQVNNEAYYWNLYNSWYEDAVIYILNNVEKVKPRGNITNLWNKLSEHNIIHSIVTSSRKDVAEAYLKNIGLFSSCKEIICIDDVSTPKPSPIPYITAMRKLNITSKNCIAIEDSYTGVISAKNAGIFTIAWVKDSNAFVNSKADLIVEKINTEIILDALDYK